MQEMKSFTNVFPDMEFHYKKQEIQLWWQVENL